ncbi:STAS domain-containing protein [Actinomadura sp. WMMA1423]|uniref:STAS domain-containing protein n=1 Tax=Actinomadura sp. WMMA1423 TaxID=2591108 RepID=UPI0011479856|nr:STAS domain-containing protein [Actinomadura sp. WMMA1423]
MDAVQDGKHTSLLLWHDPHDRLRISIENRDTCVLARVDGEIDYLTADAFREHVLSHSPGTWRIVLDLQDVRFCDSSGLGALVGLWKTVNARRGRLVLSRPSPVCGRILQRTGLDEHMLISPTLRHALATVAAEQADPRPSPLIPNARQDAS